LLIDRELFPSRRLWAAAGHHGVFRLTCRAAGGSPARLVRDDHCNADALDPV
jgi:hypothetical protein